MGLAGGAAAWSVQSLVNVAVAAHACYPQLQPLRSPGVSGVRGIALAAGVVALLVCAAASLVAWRAWRRTRGERHDAAVKGRAHAPGASLLETGEGRTRFMALSGCWRVAPSSS